MVTLIQKTLTEISQCQFERSPQSNVDLFSLSLQVFICGIARQERNIATRIRCCGQQMQSQIVQELDSTDLYSSFDFVLFDVHATFETSMTTMAIAATAPTAIPAA
jgi:transcription elongation factor Elf1